MSDYDARTDSILRPAKTILASKKVGRDILFSKIKVSDPIHDAVCHTRYVSGTKRVQSFWCITCTFLSAFECVEIAFARAQALLFLDELFALETALDQRNIGFQVKAP